jgi:flagellar basal body-associated protein FliL
LLILPLLNTVAVLATIGFFYYSKFIYKRPIITEESERERLAQIHASPTPLAQPGLITFDPITVNISTASEQPKPESGTFKQLEGKFHYVTIGFALEIRDRNQKELIESLKPFILDQLIALVGKKKLQDLTHVHGRYTLHSQLIESTNKLVTSKFNLHSKQEVVTNVYFTQFIVQ